MYRGPDERYDGKDICYGYNEDSLTIYDVTDKSNVTNIISRTSYFGGKCQVQNVPLILLVFPRLWLVGEVAMNSGTLSKA